MLSVQYDSKQNISWTYIINIVLKTIPFKINKYIFPQFYHTGYAEHGKISLWTIYMCKNSNKIYLLVQETNLYWCFSHDLELQRNPQHTHTQLQSYEDWDKRLLFFLLRIFPFLSSLIHMSISVFKWCFLTFSSVTKLKLETLFCWWDFYIEKKSK